MNNSFFKRILAALPLLAAMAASHAAAPAGAIDRLSGLVMATTAEGRVKALSAGSKLDVGDTLSSETDSFVRIRLDDGNEVVMGPSTRLKVELFGAAGAALSLLDGKLQVTGAATSRPGRFTIAAGGTTIDAGPATFEVAFVPESSIALRESYRRTSLAALSAGTTTDAMTDAPLRDAMREVVALTTPGPGARAPGLYVMVLDGIINLSNPGGSQSFSAGQFGFTPNLTQPPVLVPNNPGIQFTPPPSFSVMSSPATGSSGGAKSNSVDCEVR